MRWSKSSLPTIVRLPNTLSPRADPPSTPLPPQAPSSIPRSAGTSAGWLRPTSPRPTSNCARSCQIMLTMVVTSPGPHPTASIGLRSAERRWNVLSGALPPPGAQASRSTAIRSSPIVRCQNWRSQSTRFGPISKCRRWSCSGSRSSNPHSAPTRQSCSARPAAIGLISFAVTSRKP